MSSSRARGYGGYHGRTPFWKILLATLLAAVILASAGILFLQRTVSFDSYGRAYFPDAQGGGSGRTAADLENLPELAFGSPEEETASSGGGTAENGETSAVEPVEETVQPEPAPVLPGPEVPWGNLRAYRVQAAPLSNAVYWDAVSILDEGSYNAVSVILKDEAGTVFFPAASAIEGAVRTVGDTRDALTALTGSSRYTIGRLCCFLDPKTSNSHVIRYGLKNTGNYIFFDGNDTNWTDPAKPDTRAYYCNLAREAAALGFDEIMLTYVGYPTVGKLDKIAYGAAPIGENLTAFLREMREALADTGVSLSIEVSKSILIGEGDPSGMTLDILAPWVDRVYAVVETWEAAPCEAAVRSVRDGAVAFVPELLDLPEPNPDRFMKIHY